MGRFSSPKKLKKMDMLLIFKICRISQKTVKDPRSVQKLEASIFYKKLPKLHRIHYPFRLNENLKTKISCTNLCFNSNCHHTTN